MDGTHVVYAGEVADEAKAALLGGARALLYPVQAGEPFGLVLAEATTCGTPVAALDRGAVPEVVEDGVTGGVFDSLEALVAGLPRVLALDRARVRAVAAERFGVERMVAGYAAVYQRAGGQPARGPRRRPADDDAERATSTAVRCWPSSPTPTTSRWPPAACWRGAPRAARACRCSACRAARRVRGDGGRDLGARRARAELATAAAALGLSDVVAARRIPTACCRGCRAGALERDIRAAIAERRPDVVVTFGEDGLYWHPDHIAIHDATRAAVAALGARCARRSTT